MFAIDRGRYNLYQGGWYWVSDILAFCDMYRIRALICWLPPTVIFALLLGCGNVLSPERFKTTRIEGTVRIGTKPLSGGFVEFLPTDGTTGVMTSAPIRPDGTFIVNQAPVGKNAVGLFGGNLPRVLSQHFNILGTTIRRNVPETPREALDIDLLEEEALYQKMMADLSAGLKR